MNVAETHRSGAVHFHLLIIAPWISQRELSAAWERFAVVRSGGRYPVSPFYPGRHKRKRQSSSCRTLGQVSALIVITALVPSPIPKLRGRCRIGERSSHTWFALTQLLGFQNVRNYDGSWTEWGSIVGAPIEK